jgi:long-chain acyl-CoA synthetase
VRTYTELAERAACLAGGLRSLGVDSGARVAILALNSDRYLEAYAAIAWVGAVSVPINTRWSLTEIAYGLGDSGATVLFVDDAFVECARRLAALAPLVRHIVHLGNDPTPAGMHGFEALIADSAPVPDAARSGEDMIGIFYTGGTTGLPKGVMLAHRGVWASAVSGIAANSAAPMTADSVYLHAAPMFHIADFGAVCGGLIQGTLSVFVPSFSAEAVLAAIETHRVTHTLLVPTMVRMLLAHPRFRSADLSSLRMIAYGASPMPEALLRETIAALPTVKLAQGYGQTELSPTVTILGAEYHVLDGEHAGRLASAGRAVACCEIEIVGADGAPAPCGTVGEVRVRGGNAMLGYWRKPAETAEVMRDSWVYTGDAGRLDAEGFLYLVDRVKDMIVTGGENVYSAEVESACAMHPAVSQCVIIGVPDDRWGESVHAIVILKAGASVSAADLIAHCHELIAGYKCPRTVEFRTEPFPLSGVGKILKRELRKPYWAEHARRVN